MTDTTVRLPGNELDVAGEEALYRSLQHFWHPVAYSADLGGRPHGVTLLGESVVVVRLGGEVRAFADRCAQCGTALSMGRLEAGSTIQCGYDGWRFGADGSSVAPASRLAGTDRSPAHLRQYPAIEQNGLVFVALADDPVFPVPPFPQWGDPAFRVVTVPAYDWNCSAARRIENYVDFAHFAWVHDGVLGDRSRPEVPDHEVRRERDHLAFGYPDFREPSAIDKNVGLGVDTDTIEGDIAYRLFMPFTVLLEQYVPGGHRYVLFFSICPLGPRRVRNFTFMARDYAMDDQTDRKMLEFNEVVVAADRPIVESQRPEELPFDLSAELHVKGADQVSIQYRRWLVELATRYGGLRQPSAPSRDGSPTHPTNA